MKWMAGQNRNGRRARVVFLSGLLLASSLWGLQGPAAALEAESLIPVGHTIGIKLFAEGVVVIGLAEVKTAQGTVTPAAACGLRVGDVIEEANGAEVASSEQFASLLQSGGTVDLSISRDGENLTLTWGPGSGTAWRGLVR